jgi:acyl-CoA-binding protein
MAAFAFRKNLTPLLGLGDKVPFEQRLSETIAWCLPRASASDLARSLRSEELRPRVLEQNRLATVSLVVSARGWRVLSQAVAVGGPSTGRLLAYFPDAELGDGAAEAETHGYFDVNNAPPWDTWVALFADGGSSDSAYREYLVAWVPAALVPIAETGMSVCMEDSITWLDRLATPVSQRVRAIISASAG